jgi:hypothetical protein
VPDAGVLDLDRPRDVGAILADGLRVYFANLATFLAIGAAISVPAELIVPGLIGGRLFATYDSAAPFSAGGAGPTNLVFGLYVTPAIWIACLGVLSAVAERRRVSAAECLRSGAGLVGSAFGPILVAGLGALGGLLLLIVPGVYLFVRWYFVVQALAVDRARGLDTLRRSAALVDGRWWRVFGSVILLTLACLPPVLVFVPFGELAGGLSGYEAATLVGDALGDTFFLPLSGVMIGLLYFDLRARSRGAGQAAATPPAS